MGSPARAFRRETSHPLLDLSSDPHEDFNLWTTTLTRGWVFDPMLHVIGDYEKSVAEYPNIPAGAANFKGYRK